MRVALIDVDSKIPNLALMKASAWHKARGDEVKLYEPLFDNPDLAYASKIFDFTPDYPYMPDCEVLRGGPGYDGRRPFRSLMRTESCRTTSYSDAHTP